MIGFFFTVWKFYVNLLWISLVNKLTVNFVVELQWNSHLDNSEIDSYITVKFTVRLQWNDPLEYKWVYLVVY